MDIRLLNTTSFAIDVLEKPHWFGNEGEHSILYDSSVKLMKIQVTHVDHSHGNDPGNQANVDFVAFM